MNYATSFPGSLSSSFLSRPGEAEDREFGNAVVCFFTKFSFHVAVAVLDFQPVLTVSI